MSNNDKSSTKRFSDRVKNYTNYRPSYPTQVIDWLIKQYQLNATSRVADIGSGTGLFTDLLMAAGLPVTAVEPNTEMREESDRLYRSNPLYSSIAGTAENTTLTANGVDLIVAAQAFHWFEPGKTKKEFQRILAPDGVLALVWNRRDSSSEFQSAYESLLQKLPEYGSVKHTRIQDSDIEQFFDEDVEKTIFSNRQEFDLTGFKGRVFSSSYTPNSNHSGYEAFDQQIDALYKKYSLNDQLAFNYRTEVYSGRLR